MFEVSWQGWQWWLGWLGWPLHCLIFESSRDHPKPSSNNEQPSILTFSFLRHHKRILRQLPGLQRALFGTNHCETYLWAWRHCLQCWRPDPVTPSHWSAMVTLGLCVCVCVTTCWCAEVCCHLCQEVSRLVTRCLLRAVEPGLWWLPEWSLPELLLNTLCQALAFKRSCDRDQSTDSGSDGASQHHCQPNITRSFSVVTLLLISCSHH